MGLRSLLRTPFGPTSAPPAALARRRERRRLARGRAAQEGGTHWSTADRHPRPQRREVSDTEGLGMGVSGTRTIEDR